MTSTVITAEFTGGTKLPNYVNGRLLYAEDLAVGQATLRQRDQWIAQAAGHGVVRGLWVDRPTGTTLSVAPGLAVNREGQPVFVPETVTLELAPTTPPPGRPLGRAIDLASFHCCGGGSGTPDAVDPTTRVVLLVARPASTFQGQTPLAPPPTSKVSPGCVARWVLDGVEFRAIDLPVPDAVAGQPIRAGTLRNLAAHWCFGTEALSSHAAWPFAFSSAWSGLDSLPTADFTRQDVPLAVYTQIGGAVDDVDNWAVRRRITRPDATEGAWSAITDDARQAAGEARWLQFQAQLQGVLAGQVPSSYYIGADFRFLPPAGLVPISASWFDSDDVRQVLSEQGSTDVLDALDSGIYSQSAPGFDPGALFDEFADWCGTVTWNVVDFALRQSWRAAPLLVPPGWGPEDEGLSESTTNGHDYVRRLKYYIVAENLLASDSTHEGARRMRNILGGATGAHTGFYILFVATQIWPVSQTQRTPFDPWYDW